MIQDDLLEFMDATACTQAAGNALFGDVIDTGSVPTLKNLGVTPIYLVISVDTTFVGATSTTQFQLCTDSTANLATSKTVHIDTGAIPVATLVAGYQLVIPLPVTANYERYMGIWVTTATATTTAGKINAFLTLDPNYNTALPDAI